ncbi:hypothetical protein MMC30_006628 [Trapelia coarctata]|nr:hypothetical protein [Trapelia coarctata]
MPSATLLSELRSQTLVCCDTLDAEVAKRLGPFEDCTSNQAIAYSELQHHRHEALLKESITLADELLEQFESMTLEQLAVEIAMVKLGMQMVPHISGYIHIQVNPFYSYSTNKIMENARRIPHLFSHLSPEFDTSSLCIKIPSTWEGLQACRVLQATGTTTLATAVFTIEQAALAGEVNCQYIAPYAHELKVHIDPNYHDPNPQLHLCVAATRYYLHHALDTRVIPASLTTTKEVMLLSGADRMAISPHVLKELSETNYASKVTREPSLFTGPSSKYAHAPKRMHFENDEAKFRTAVTRSDGGENERKLVQVINILCDVQLKLEEMMKKLHGELQSKDGLV